jgi:hypothetical protein
LIVNGSTTPSDTTPPVLNLPNNITGVEATGPDGATVTYSADATDGVDGTIAANCLPVSGSTFPVGVTPVACSATDAAGNTSTGTFTVTVVDRTPPKLNLPGNITEEATGPDGAAVSFTATADDIVAGDVPVNCDADSGDTFPLGDTTVTCTATDDYNNTSTSSFTVTVVDTTAPTLDSHADITGVEATSSAGAVVNYTKPSATDTVDSNPTVSCSPAPGATFPLGDTTVSCTAKDASGNESAAKTFKVTVVDTTAPQLNLPANITKQATSNSQAVVTYTASATDLVDGSLTPTCTPASGSTFSAGTTTVTCTSTDAHGNKATGSFTVTVNYGWTGFFRPVDNPDTLNSVKAGSAIPVKFSLAGNQGLNIFAANFPVSQKITCDTSDPVDAIEETVTAGGSSLSYDSSLDQYNYVWKTDKSWAGTCRQLTVKTADGTPHVAIFKLLK